MNCQLKAYINIGHAVFFFTTQITLSYSMKSGNDFLYKDLLIILVF
jgi:hypothetical protein